MSKAEEQALKAYPREDDAWGDEWQKRVGFVKGYNQAEQDLMDKAKQWFTKYIADKSVQLLWCEFEQFITEN